MSSSPLKRVGGGLRSATTPITKTHPHRQGILPRKNFLEIGAKRILSLRKKLESRSSSNAPFLVYLSGQAILQCKRSVQVLAAVAREVQ